eukprot:259636-Hanusia_phi.AAC.1
MMFEEENMAKLAREKLGEEQISCIILLQRFVPESGKQETGSSKGERKCRWKEMEMEEEEAAS